MTTDTFHGARPLTARRTHFDLAKTPLHWIPGDAYTSHLINVLHMIAPVGERWFIAVLRDALPLIQDERLRRDVKGFVGQEATHAHAHDTVLKLLDTYGVETDRFCQQLTWYLNQLIGGKKPPVPMPERLWLLWRLSVVAALEQLTYVLGDWAIDAEALDLANADPAMLDLLRWHGCEEVEHCDVAFDALNAIGGPLAYPFRVAGMLFSMPSLTGWWTYGLHDMAWQDPATQGRTFTILDYIGSARMGRAPGFALIAAMAEYLHPGFHPGDEHAYHKAAEYLKTSPGVGRPAA